MILCEICASAEKKTLKNLYQPIKTIMSFKVFRRFSKVFPFRTKCKKAITLFA